MQLKGVRVWWLLVIVSYSLQAQDIIRTRWQGVGFQQFISQVPLTGFSTYGPDNEGFVYLCATASDGQTYPFIRSKWQGISFHDFETDTNDFITGFSTSGPDSEGYVYLICLTSQGNSQSIIKSKLQDFQIQSYEAPPGYAIMGFNVLQDNNYIILQCEIGLHNQEGDTSNWRQNSIKLNSVSSGDIILYTNESLARYLFVEIYNTSGDRVFHIQHFNIPAQLIKVELPPKLPSGTYFVRIKLNDKESYHKLVLLK